MKKILIVAGIGIAALLALGFARDQILKAGITAAASQMIGAPVQMDGFQLGLLSQSVRITGFRISNPRDFSKAFLIDIGKISVVLDGAALFKGKIHLKSAEFDLKEMTLETNREGKLNVDALKIAKPKETKQAKGPSKQMPFQVDELKLGIGRIVMKDYSVPGVPATKVNEINIQKTYKNITGVQQLAALILSEPMKSAGIQSSGIYGAAMMTGVGIVPVAISSAFLGKDSVQQSFDASMERVYEAGRAVLGKMGKLLLENKEEGILTAKVKGVSVTLKLKQLGGGKTEVSVAARKYMLPEPSIAGGVLYEIAERLK